MSVEEQNAGTTQVREAHRFDERALAAWMRDHVPEAEGPLVIRQFKGGQSNPTFRLDTPTAPLSCAASRRA